MLSDCRIQLVAALPDGRSRIRCPQCGMERTIACPIANYHRQCPKGDNPPPVLPQSTPVQPPAPADGVGAEFLLLAKSLGFTACQLCKDTADKMNREGIEWCVEHRAELVAEVKQNFESIANGTAAQLEKLEAEAKRRAPYEPMTDAGLHEQAAREQIKGRLATVLTKAKMLTGATIHAGINLACGKFVPSPLHEFGLIGSMLDEAIRQARDETLQSPHAQV